MLLKNHIATRFLTDETLIFEMMESTHPEIWAKMPSVEDEKFDEFMESRGSQAMKEFYFLMIPKDQRAYYITNTVVEKLDMLKVEKKPGQWHDWTVFKGARKGKYTFIFDDNKLFRLWIDENRVWICMVYFELKKGSNIDGKIRWDMFHVDLKNNGVSENFMTERVQMVETFIYKLLCFFFLSDNEEIEVQPGRKHGTKKSGKLINTLNVPITIVNSRWNVTVVRTEGFEVSGHFRLQPYGAGRSETKMIFIEPFQKHGYVRRAKSENLTIQK